MPQDYVERVALNTTQVHLHFYIITPIALKVNGLKHLSFRRIIPTGKIYRVLLSTTFKKCQKYKESCSFLM